MMSQAAASAPPLPRVRLTSAAVAAAAWLVVFLVLVLSLVIWAGRGATPQPLSFMRGPLAVLSISLTAMLFATVGGILAGRVGRNPVGWLLLLIGALLGSILPVSLMVDDTLAVIRPAPLATLLAAWAISSFVVPTAIAAQTVVMVVFPDGRPACRCRGATIVASVAGAALLSMGMALSPALRAFPMLHAPMALPETFAGVLSVARMLGVALLVLGTVGAAASMVVRYRSSGPVVRTQLRWVVLAGGILAVAVTPYAIGRYVLVVSEEAGEMLVAFTTLGASVFPVMVAIAILRHDLFDIDRILRRTLVYVPLTAFLAGLYAAAVTLFQRLFVALTGDTSDAAVVLTSLLLAASFTPVRSSLEGAVKRRFLDGGEAGAGGALGSPAAIATSAAGAARALVSTATSAAGGAAPEQEAMRLAALEERIAELEAAALRARPERSDGTIDPQVRQWLEGARRSRHA